MEQAISDKELSEFCQWYKQHYRKVEAYECAVLICMSGYFHTIPRKAKSLLERCKSLNLIEIKRNVVNLK